MGSYDNGRMLREMQQLLPLKIKEEDREWRNVGGLQKLEKAGKRIFPLSLQKGRLIPDFSPVRLCQTSKPLNCERINLSCFSH